MINDLSVIALCICRTHGFINGIFTIIIYRKNKRPNSQRSDDLDTISNMIVGFSGDVTNNSRF